MRNSYKIWILSFGMLVVLLSCGKSEMSDAKEYMTYLANPEHGLVQQRTVAGLSIKAKYIPEDYLVYMTVKELENPGKKTKDSIAGTYKNSLTYMITIGPAQNEDFDVTRVGVENYEEFATRIENMAFNAQDWISITVKGKEYKPEIVRLENINALEKSRNFIVVFNSPRGSETDFRKENMTLSYSDELFNTGLSKFIFYSKDIQSIPTFIF